MFRRNSRKICISIVDIKGFYESLCDKTRFINLRRFSCHWLNYVRRTTWKHFPVCTFHVSIRIRASNTDVFKVDASEKLTAFPNEFGTSSDVE